MPAFNPHLVLILCSVLVCLRHVPSQTVPALQAADNLLLAKEVVANAVSRHGLAVTWLPKPMAGEAGSGVHMHFSLWRVC